MGSGVLNISNCQLGKYWLSYWIAVYHEYIFQHRDIGILSLLGLFVIVRQYSTVIVCENIITSFTVDFFQVPLVVSLPHFYMGDQKFIDAIDGMAPDWRQHNTHLDVEPVCTARTL